VHQIEIEKKKAPTECFQMLKELMTYSTALNNGKIVCSGEYIEGVSTLNEIAINL
jgi:hypothetical protein